MKSYILFFVLLFTTTYNMQAQTKDQDNPFFTEWTTPFQTPPFDLILDEHYLPALKEGIKQKRNEFEFIISNREVPTFQNTIEAMEKSGKLLSKVSRVFSNINSANSNTELQRVAE